MKKLIPLLLLVLDLHGQNLTFRWARAFSTSTLGGAFSHDVTTDKHGNVYALGQYLSPVDLDPGPGTATFACSGQSDIFLVKLDSAGNYLWGATFGSTGKEQGGAVCVDPSGDVFISGICSNTVDFDPGPGVTNVNGPNGLSQAFICKLSANGTFGWVRHWRAYFDSGNGLTTDTYGNVYTTGGAAGGGDYDPGPAVAVLGGPNDLIAYVSKFDGNGNFQWARGFIGNHYAYGMCVAVDNAKNIVVGGIYRGTNDFDPGPGTNTFTAVGNFDDGFLVKLDSTGSHVWSTAFGNTIHDGVDAVVIDPADNIYFTGIFSSIVDFDPGTSTYTMSSNGGYATMICKYSPQGALLWAKSNAGPSQDLVIGTGISLDGAGNVMICGRTNVLQPMDFDPGPGTFMLGGLGSEEMWIQVLTGTGNFVTAAVLQGYGNDYVFDGEMDAFGNYYMTGSFQYTLDFDPATTTHTIATASKSFVYAFVNKLRLSCAAPPPPVITSTAVVFCKNSPAVISASGTGAISWFNVASGGNAVGSGATFTASSASAGQYTYYAQDHTCGPGPRTPFSIAIKAPTVNISAGSAPVCIGQATTLHVSGAITYTWADGSNFLQLVVVPQAASTVYSVTGSDAAGCRESVVMTLLAQNCTGTELAVQKNSCTVFPNPSPGLFQLKTEGFTGHVRLHVLNLQGTIVHEQETDAENVTFDLGMLPEGVYIAELKSGNELRCLRLLLQK